MCGIAGSTHIFSPETWLCQFIDVLAHRGPDDRGIWQNCSVGLVLAHRRLSIIDPSANGHQPMISRSGRYVIVCNGEIYNFQELRTQLASLGHRFHGHSDTEVMLASFEQWGIDGAVARFAGMFAFAAFDDTTKTLYLVRDRLGIKPLYYGQLGNSFVFASELKALRQHPQFRAEVDRQALSLYMKYSYVPAPHSIYRGIYKLPAATILRLSLENRPQQIAPELYQYWSLAEIATAKKGINEQSEREMVEGLHALLAKVVARHCLADVPLGAFLSGGIDSSTIVALMQAHSRIPVKTFTIGFDDTAYDEAPHAQKIARHLGTVHTELRVTAADALAVVPQLAEIYDEPFADSSQIPTFLISQLTRQKVIVSLSGDGGDELFAGYNRYFWGRAIWQKIGWLPWRMRGQAVRILTSLAPWLNQYCRRSPLKFAEKLPKLLSAFAARDPQDMYQRFVSQWSDSDIVIGAEPAASPWLALEDFAASMMYTDAMTYLPDDILAKVDRASMATSLEVRVPFLDHEVVEYAWRLPIHCKIRKHQGKWILRRILDEYVPASFFQRPKMGFAIPLDAWLRGPLREWAESLLSESALAEDGFFQPAPIRQKWHEHLSRRRDWHAQLWPVLVFQMWKQRYLHNSWVE